MTESPSGPGRRPETICWSCGAPNDVGSSECWLCQRRDWNRYPGIRRRLAPAPSGRGPLSTIGGWMVLIAGIGVALGIVVAAPPVAIGLVLSSVPALAITEFKAYRRRRRGESVSGWQRLIWFVEFTILIPILLAALGIALILLCIALLR
jgi:hypothetical protein